MDIEILSRKAVWEPSLGLHGYQGWPSVARLKNGRLALTASAFRLNHICPFGKCVISYSEDEGETWTLPAPVIDTPLDDRDGGIAAFGKSGVIVTSFNNTPARQRMKAENPAPHHANRYREYVTAYLDIVEREFDWEQYLGSTFRLSNDNGITFGELKKSPVSSPHGPVERPDGTLLYVGRVFGAPTPELASYQILPDGTCERIGAIESLGSDYLSYEPHAVILPDGTVIVHIRMEKPDKSMFTIFQTESHDGGRTFTTPHQILSDHGGAPAHLLLDGDVLISVYGHREAPYGIRAMFSFDGGVRWDTDHVLTDDGWNWDLGYPSSVRLNDGTILTVYYARPGADEPARIFEIKWKYNR